MFDWLRLVKMRCWRERIPIKLQEKEAVENSAIQWPILPTNEAPERSAISKKNGTLVSLGFTELQNFHPL